eukprot:TRINITY_DN3861_c3_g1_i3.p1 TRINITY_DN3861_c3_g1~~TRINITY_DN3861_c3_g1_i3.p1  ORF type:complete len:109 (+),score=6.06 TRINITY_DN3861_c3_g1_i3:828-1154(+)
MGGEKLCLFLDQIEPRGKTYWRRNQTKKKRCPGTYHRPEDTPPFFKKMAASPAPPPWGVKYTQQQKRENLKKKKKKKKIPADEQSGQGTWFGCFPTLLLLLFLLFSGG